MITVKFVQDFRGKLTKEQFYRAGDVASFDVVTAQALLDERRVVTVDSVVEPIAEAIRRRKKAN